MMRDWTLKETAQARALREAGRQYREIAPSFGRTVHAVKRHLQYRAENPASTPKEIPNA